MAPESNGDYRFRVPVTGVVLAAGRSERMGRPKALLAFRGRSFVEAVLHTMKAAGVTSRLVVAGRNAAQLESILPSGVGLVSTGTGPHPIDSVRAGIRMLRGSPATEAVLVWPVDLPHVQLATVQAVLARFRGAATPIIAPSFRHRRGHPVLWARATWEALLSHSAGEREGARGVALLFPVLHVEVPDAAIVDDIDTPEAYARLLAGGAERGA